MKGYPALLRAQGLQLFGGGLARRRIHVAHELHVASERNGAQLPARAATIVETEELGTEADREGLHADSAPAADQIVAHLVYEDDNREHEQERHQRSENEASRIEQRMQDVVQLDKTLKPLARPECAVKAGKSMAAS